MQKDVVKYIEDEYLGKKKLTNGTRNTINALVKAYGQEVVLHTVTKKENVKYLSETNFNNQAHFESVVLYLLRKNAPYMKKAYQQDIAELQYERESEPPVLPVHEQTKKEIKKWVF